MAGRKYEKLTIENFGMSLLASGDLDPIYNALYKIDLPRPQLKRWLLAYWCFYSAGVASYLSESKGDHYWTDFFIAARNEQPALHGGRWERGKERRHFRGQQAVKATNELAGRYPQPEAALDHLVQEGDGQRLPFSTISDRVQEWRGFGQWISFKVGDMIDRLGICPIDFAFDEAMYADPTKAALMQWKVMHGAPPESTIDDEPAAVREVVAYLKHFFCLYKAPPLMDRAIGIQEIETILCKWKSHMGGHYPLKNDIHEIRHGVSPWTDHCETAARFFDAMPGVS